MREYPSSPLIGIAVLVFDDDGRILLVKRKYPPQQGKWSLPGGHMNLGESLLDTARRELFEETGLLGTPVGIVDVNEYITFDVDGRVFRQYVILYVLMSGLTGELTPGSDALDAKFTYPYYALRELDLAKTTLSFLNKLVSGKLQMIKPVSLVFEKK